MQLFDCVQTDREGLPEESSAQGRTDLGLTDHIYRDFVGRMAGPDISPSKPGRINKAGFLRPTNVDTTASDHPETAGSSPLSEEAIESPLKSSKGQTFPSASVDAESYLNSLQSLRSSSRSNSVYSLSRISLSSQLSQLTSLSLPDASSLSSSIAGIPTAPAAAKTLASAADQIRKWLQKASEVLRGLDAEDDVEWAAAGGREGLGDLDAAIGKFEGLIGVYVRSIDDLQVREDISKVSSDQQKAVVDQMEQILEEWNGVKLSLKAVKRQVELAMEWEELWNTVLGDIGLELEALSVQVFEMEEARHQSMATDTAFDGTMGLDVQELDTIIEETPNSESKSNTLESKVPSAITISSPLNSPGLSMPQDDTKLLSLFARMQPLRASLDFLPMTLAAFHMKAKDVLPTACEELQTRKRSLEKKWKQLESEAEGLRQELGEDRWVVVFRNAARQAQKMCESVERSIVKLQETIDAGTQHSNPPLLAKKLEAYEAKKSHYGPAIKKVLAIIEKGVSDRQTVHGEVLRLREEARGRWSAVEIEMKDMDLALEDLTMHKTQQLRDSISSIVSMDRSAADSAVDTPGSSPASSVAIGPSNGGKREPSPGMNGSSRRSSLARPTGSRRYFSLPSSSSNSTHLPVTQQASRNLSSTTSSRNASPSPYSKSSATPTPGSRSKIPGLAADNKPRWNSSSKVDYFEFGSKPRPLPFSQGQRKTSMPFRPGSSAASHSASASTNALSSPLGRSSPAPSAGSGLREPGVRPSGTYSSLNLRRASAAPTSSARDWAESRYKTPPTSSDGQPHPRAGLRSNPSTPASAPINNATAVLEDEDEDEFEDEVSPSVRHHAPQQHRSKEAGIKRISMLPLPKNHSLGLPSPGAGAMTARTGRDSAFGSRSASRAASRTRAAWK